jgi:hypothetical protein
MSWNMRMWMWMFILLVIRRAVEKITIAISLGTGVAVPIEFFELFVVVERDVFFFCFDFFTFATGVFVV